MRREAEALGLAVAMKPDSQDLCFVPGGDYRRYLREHAPDVLVPGDVVDQASGDVLGTHDGAAGFTIGQRRGLPAVGERRHVAEIDARRGRVTVASRAHLMRSVVSAFEINWIDEPVPSVGTTRRVEARIRHASAAEPATLTVLADGAARIEFDKPVFAPAPGQAVVAYVGDAVLCGGVLSGEPTGTVIAARGAESAPGGDPRADA